MPEGQTRTLLILTFATGIVDAVSFVGLGQVFAAMQTGNVIFLGLGIGGSAGAPVGAPLLALAGFLLGGLGAVVLAAAGPGRPAALRRMVATEVALLALATLFALLTEPTPNDAGAYTLVAVLSFTMGLRNTIARRVGGPNLATTVLNLSLAPLAAVPAAAAAPADLRLRAVAFAAILAGAVAGALLLDGSVALALGGAALVSGLALATARPAAAPARP